MEKILRILRLKGQALVWSEEDIRRWEAAETGTHTVTQARTILCVQLRHSWAPSAKGIITRARHQIGIGDDLRHAGDGSIILAIQDLVVGIQHVPGIPVPDFRNGVERHESHSCLVSHLFPDPCQRRSRLIATAKAISAEKPYRIPKPPVLSGAAGAEMKTMAHRKPPGLHSVSLIRACIG